MTFPRLPKLPPLVLEWSSATLPRRPIWTNARLTAAPEDFDDLDGLPTGPRDQPFDFCARVGRLAAAVVRHCPEFQHVNVEQVLFTVTPARNGRAHGLQAKVTPLRFRGGELVRRHGTRHYQAQRWRLDGRELLYVVSFCLPRFLNLDFDEKFVTLFHELYHIGPAFDGDLRRHAGRCHVHTHSQRQFDARMGELARAYLAGGADPDLHAFLRLNFAQLRRRHGAVVGVKVPRPRIIPVRSPTEY